MEAGEGILDWAVAARPLAGQPCSGDLHGVAPFPGGVLVAVVDGLGHGPEAADVARRLIDTVEEHPGDSVEALLRRSDEALRGTRGAVVSLASFDGRRQEMTWLGLGNVEGILFRAPSNARLGREALVLRGGVVGSRLPSIRAASLPVGPGDTLIFATDGIRADFSEHAQLGQTPRQLADRILASCAKASDDALVLVARYLGGGS
jgi:phosphoserine phosphatase RsbX